MLSNKLTFSLASLIVLLMFAFVATPAMAQNNAVLSGSLNAANDGWDAELTFDDRLDVSKANSLIDAINDDISNAEGAATKANDTVISFDITAAITDFTIAGYEGILDIPAPELGATFPTTDLEFKEIVLVSITAPEATSRERFTVTVSFNTAGGQPTGLILGNLVITHTDTMPNPTVVAGANVGTISVSPIGASHTYEVYIIPGDALAEGDITVALHADFSATLPTNTANRMSSTKLDVTAPTLMISRSLGETGDVDGPFRVDFAFGEAVTGFDLDDITVTNGDAEAPALIALNVYRSNITPAADGAVTVEVRANAVTDAAGNSNLKASLVPSVTADLPEAPAAPIGVAVADEVGQISVTWTNGAATGFEYSTDGTTWIVVSTVSAYPLVITGPAGTAISVQIRVAASGNVPAGVASTAVSGTPTAPAALAQPTGVTVAPNDDGDAYEVSWTTPSDTANINGYYVSFNPIEYVEGADETSYPIGTDIPTSVSVWSTSDTSDQNPASAPANAVEAPAEDIAALVALDDGNGGTTPTTPVVPDGEATVEAGAITFELTAAQLAAGNFIVIANDPGGAEIISDASYSLFDIKDASVDLEDFFTFNGGTIQLLGPAESTAKDVVISEVMWGGDVNFATGTPARAASQWLELYVTTGGTSKGAADGAADGDTTNADATDGDWMITFTRGAATPAAVTGMVVVDEISNQGLGRWNVLDGAHGSNGRTRMDANANSPAVAAVPFVSMYRDIGYINVTGADAPKKTRKEQLDALKDGTRSGSWKQDAVNRGSFQRETRYATPGEAHVSGVITTGDTTAVARDGVVFNEIANRSTDVNDWIELHNQKTGSVKINGWQLSNIENSTTETVLFEFKSDEDINIPGGGYLVVVNTDPSGTSLAVGQNVDDARASKQGVDTFYYVNEGLVIPKVGLLLLRSGTDKNKTHEKIVDVAAIGDGYSELRNKDYNTDVFPLKSTGAGATDDNTENDAKTWVRDQTKDLFNGDAWKSDGGVTGAGIDRNATAYNSGTPGYANDAVKTEFADADGKAVYTGSISISEIMVDQTRRDLAQWIEIYNSSRTEAVNISGWELKVSNVNSTDLDSRINWDIKIDGDLIIAPNQTALIVSSSGRYSREDIPDSSIYNLQSKHKRELETSSQRDSVLSVEGFNISLSDGRDVVADEVGNIDDNARTDDAPAWALPTDADERSSLIRVYLGDGDADDGTTAEGWILASMTNLSPETYYGDSDDIASPGSREGSPLPVSLSSFRPARDAATGAVVIRWITESELNNAGFNILRSETKNGEFEVVNLKGIIAGHGTTSEKHTYTWTDTTAKPNVVYYYQIEDVSLDGNRTTLRTTHLRGNVNAAGKLATRWGELKTYGK